jgi:hypothetical protein
VMEGDAARARAQLEVLTAALRRAHAAAAGEEGVGR